MRDWYATVVRGVVGGLVAGLVFLGVTMWFADSMGDPAEMPLKMIATVVQGKGAMDDGSASAGVGLAVHLALSAAYGVLFAAVVRRLRTNGSVALAGTAFGVALYVVNFHVLAPAAFPVLEMANKPFELAIHVVFGLLVSFAAFSADARRHEPVLASHRERVPVGHPG